MITFLGLAGDLIFGFSGSTTFGMTASIEKTCLGYSCGLIRPLKSQTMLFLNLEVGTFLSMTFSSQISISSESSALSSINFLGVYTKKTVEGVSFGVILPKLNGFWKIYMLI